MFALILIGILIISTIAVLAARPDWVTEKLADKIKGPKNKEKAVKEKHNPVVEHGKEQCIVQREINGKMKTTNICIGETKDIEATQRNSGHGKSEKKAGQDQVPPPDLETLYNGWDELNWEGVWADPNWGGPQ